MLLPSNPCSASEVKPSSFKWHVASCCETSKREMHNCSNAPRPYQGRGKCNILSEGSNRHCCWGCGLSEREREFGICSQTVQTSIIQQASWHSRGFWATEGTDGICLWLITFVYKLPPAWSMVFGLLDFKKQLKLYMRVDRLQDTLAFSCIKC